MNLATAFTESARKHDDKPAIFWGEETISYHRIWRESLWVASELGIKPGERVAIWLKNRPEFVSALFGVLLPGGVVVPVNNFLKPDEVHFILRDSGAKILISDHEMREGTAKLREMIPGLRVIEVESIPKETQLPSDTELKGINSRSRDDLAVVIYTSGTTG